MPTPDELNISASLSDFVAGVRHLSDVEGNQLRAAATAPPSQLQEPNLQFGQQASTFKLVCFRMGLQLSATAFLAAAT